MHFVGKGIVTMKVTRSLPVLGFALFLLISCSPSSTKELNESSAKALLKTAVASEFYYFPVGPVANLFARTRTDYRSFSGVGSGAILQQLLSRGYVLQQPEIISYPKLSGTFSGNSHWSQSAVNPDGTRTDPLCASAENEYTVAMDPDANSFSGTHVLRYGCTNLKGNGYTSLGQVAPNRSTEKFTGTIEADGRVQVGEYRQMTVLSEQKGLYTTNGSYVEQGPTGVLKLGDWSLTGKATGQKVDVKYYTYKFSPEAEKQVDQGRARAGRLEIGAVSNLRLVTDTEAIAEFSWEASLNDLGKLLTHENPKGVGHAEFGKKPDGTWFVDRWGVD